RTSNSGQHEHKQKCFHTWSPPVSLALEHQKLTVPAEINATFLCLLQWTDLAGDLFVDRSPDIGPDRLDFLIFENAVPGGHVVFSASDRINKSVMLIRSQAPQIERPAPAYIVQIFPVAAGAALRVNLGTGFDPAHCVERSKPNAPDEATGGPNQLCPRSHS